MGWSTFWDTHLLHSMFHPGLPLAEKVLRPILVYFALIFLLRVFGKRELAQLNPFDLVVLLSLSNTVQNAIIGEDSSVTGGLVGAVSLFGINYLVVRFLFKHRRLDQLVEGRPTVLIDGGKLHKAAMSRELLTISELVAVAHRQGFAHLHEIDRCVLEPGGTFTIQGREPRARDRQHRELLDRLEHLSRQVEELKGRFGDR